MNHYSRPFFFVLTVINSGFVYSQKPNTCTFIEPNISVSFDSNLFKISQRYSNSFYGTESYDFSCQLDKVNKINIHIEADHPKPSLTQQSIDSVMLNNLREMKGEKPGSLSIVIIDTGLRQMNGFSLTGFVAYDKVKKQYGAFIGGFHVTENDITEIWYSSENRNDLAKEYEIFKLFLQGFKSYSKKQIEQEDSLIKSSYTVQVQATKEIPEDFRPGRKTYSGIVTVVQPLKHKIAEVRLNIASGQEVFLPSDSGEVIISFYDKETGHLEKKGELVLLNSFGKKVRIPFAFSYENNGAK